MIYQRCGIDLGDYLLEFVCTSHEFFIANVQFVLHSLGIQHEGALFANHRLEHTPRAYIGSVYELKIDFKNPDVIDDSRMLRMRLLNQDYTAIPTVCMMVRFAMVQDRSFDLQRYFENRMLVLLIDDVDIEIISTPFVLGKYVGRNGVGNELISRSCRGVIEIEYVSDPAGFIVGFEEKVLLERLGCGCAYCRGGWVSTYVGNALPYLRQSFLVRARQVEYIVNRSEHVMKQEMRVQRFRMSLISMHSYDPYFMDDDTDVSMGVEDLLHHSWPCVYIPGEGDVYPFQSFSLPGCGRISFSVGSLTTEMERRKAFLKALAHNGEVDPMSTQSFSEYANMATFIMDELEKYGGYFYAFAQAVPLAGMDVSDVEGYEARERFVCKVCSFLCPRIEAPRESAHFFTQFEFQ